MKTTKFKFAFKALLSIFSIVLLTSCGGDDSSGTPATPVISVDTSAMQFPDTDVLSVSASQNISVAASNLSSALNVSVTANFQVSLNNTDFSSQVAISAEDANAASQTVYVRFAPTENAVGSNSGTLTFQSSQATSVTKVLNGVGVSITPVISVNSSALVFEDTVVGEMSSSQELVVNGDNLETNVNLSVAEGFSISLDDNMFTNELQVDAETANNGFSIYVRFTPTVVASISGALDIQNAEAENVSVDLSGEGTPIIHNYLAFNEQALGFGGGFNQSAAQFFNLHSDLSNIKEIKMYLQIDCPATGCDDWDRFANVQVKDPSSGNWYEMGRYITPYWTGTQQLERGLEFDVTDFKSLLEGNVELRIYIENWTAKADIITVDFDFIEGVPDYPYYAVSEVLGYHGNSISGVPYGVGHNFDLTKQISIPSNAESTHLRTTISGWGHATPNDPDGRPCAEWCYRTHDVMLDGVLAFQHELGPLGCASNPISNQSPGNWTPNRAGWCPGMVVPARIDQFGSPNAGSAFNFEYVFSNWVSDGGNGNAYYATSTYVVVKSNTMISKPTVTD
ncbi:peptide-N-glycosidase F-related protein [Pontimicrobium sp. IMCC45349]|uniref:peptide-N-glycosidase F-related protein n=1 Tax=Pontimicrobium sp. IMCC45349 TaxID=3391574 RepID=UPI0039A1375C